MAPWHIYFRYSLQTCMPTVWTLRLTCNTMEGSAPQGREAAAAITDGIVFTEPINRRKHELQARVE